jgi:hypothetical protein
MSRESRLTSTFCRAGTLAVILALPLVLTACGGTEKKQKDQRTAAGEILPGSISDSILPYDTVHSQPPLAPPTEPGKGSPKGATVAEPDAADAAVAADPDRAAEAPAEPAEAPADPAAPTQ